MLLNIACFVLSEWLQAYAVNKHKHTPTHKALRPIHCVHLFAGHSQCFIHFITSGYRQTQRAVRGTTCVCSAGEEYLRPVPALRESGRVFREPRGNHLIWTFVQPQLSFQDFLFVTWIYGEHMTSCEM